LKILLTYSDAVDTPKVESLSITHKNVFIVLYLSVFCIAVPS